MRRVPLAAAAVGAGILIATLFGGRALAAQIALSPSFRASRIQVDTAPTTLKMPGPTTVTAIVEDWHGATTPKVPVNVTILSGPNKGKGLPTAVAVFRGFVDPTELEVTATLAGGRTAEVELASRRADAPDPSGGPGWARSTRRTTGRTARSSPSPRSARSRSTPSPSSGSGAPRR